MVDENLEEGVHEQDPVGQDAAAVQQHRLYKQNDKQKSTNPSNQSFNLINMTEMKTQAVCFSHQLEMWWKTSTKSNFVGAST